MKKLLTLLLALSLAQLCAAQQCPFYRTYMERGDSIMSLKSPNFEAAINAYSAAMLHCPDSAEQVRQSLVKVFKRIESLKNTAWAAQQKAIKEEAKTKDAKKELEKVSAETQKLMLRLKEEENRRLEAEAKQEKPLRITITDKKETLYSIAKKYKLKVSELKKKLGRDKLKFGETIEVSSNMYQQPQWWACVLSVDGSTLTAEAALQLHTQLLRPYGLAPEMRPMPGERYYTLLRCTTESQARQRCDQLKKDTALPNHSELWVKPFYQ